MTQTIIGGGTFEGELDNIRIMDIATSATPTAEDAMSTALVRKLMLTTLKPMTGVGSIKNIKALFTFDGSFQFLTFFERNYSLIFRFRNSLKFNFVL